MEVFTLTIAIQKFKLSTNFCYKNILHKFEFPLLQKGENGALNQDIARKVLNLHKKCNLKQKESVK